MLQNALQLGNQKVDEEALFTAMLNYFNNTYPCATWLRKTHQYYVRFNCVDPRTQMYYHQKRCEISDLLIVTYSPLQQIAKATFLQAKYSKKKYQRPFSFKGDAFQYFLLSQRPIITDTHNPSFPQDILSNAQRDSIGSFGVFYRNKQMDFSFSVATDIQIVSPTCTKGAILQYKHRRTCRKRHPLDIDTRTLFGANAFEKALLCFEIGSPFDPSTIKDILSVYYSQNQNVKNLCNNMNINVTDDSNSIEHPHVLIVNVDEIAQ